MDILRPIIELSVFFPGILLAYLPMRRYLRISIGKLVAIIIPLITLLCLIGGSICYFFHIQTLYILFVISIIVMIICLHTLTITRWKSISVLLAICGVFSYLRNIAKAIDVLIYPGNPEPWLCLPAAVVYFLLCFLFVVFAYYPATHAARRLLEDDSFAQTWYVFWILPILFISLNLFLTPLNPELLYEGRLMQIYIIVSFVLLGLLLLFYAMFYLMATSLNKNDHLRQENQFLSMQQTQYYNLQTSIEETKRVRHDMRHHITILQTLAKRREWEELEAYLSTVQKEIPDTSLNLCDNLATDSVVSHYGLLYKKNNIPFSIELDLPKELPVPEIDFCTVLSNLMENALEASLQISRAKRMIKVQAYLHSKTVILLTVENTFNGIIREKSGIYQSSKRHGNGVGIQSIRHIAEKNGGYSRFTHTDGIFHANIMIRGM